MNITNNMGLIAWDLGVDGYDHEQLAGNFNLIDLHDHAAGRGRQIGNAGLQDRAVTTVKIALGAVTQAELSDNSVSNAKLENGSVTEEKVADNAVGTDQIIDAAVTSAKIAPDFLPVGSVIMWGWVGNLPSGDWEVMDGRPWSSIPNDMGFTTGNILDMRNRFPLGASTGATGTGFASAPAIGQTGGVNGLDLSHDHFVFDHSHVIPPGGIHSHQFYNDSAVLHDLATHPVALPGSGGTRQALYVPGTTTGVSGDASMESAASHNHGGETELAGGGWSVDTSKDLSAVENRPRNMGLLFIMRVRG